ncbi:hypothetical protein CRM22_003249 [Opisthorchis felineus]|uniref:Uncharacterized protein n=1 Tax=Opisthorchis felineus TaxID=147828 RepID=A0A4S2M251_OPIFE|nr:hypothetical protein CRM22_003249 [Opisthorchis felineus]
MKPLLSFALVSELLFCIANAGHSDVECFTHMVQCVRQCAAEGLLKTDCENRTDDVLEDCFTCAPCEKLALPCVQNELRKKRFADCKSLPIMMGMWR